MGWVCVSRRWALTAASAQPVCWPVRRRPCDSVWFFVLCDSAHLCVSMCWSDRVCMWAGLTGRWGLWIVTGPECG